VALERVAFVPLPAGDAPGFDHADVHGSRVYVAHTGADRIDALDGERHLGSIPGLPLAGRPRWAVFDGDRDRVYANLREPAVILVVDPASGEVERAIGVPVAGPHGLWIDRGRLFCAADGEALVVLDRDSGDVLRELPLPGVPDVVMHDAAGRRLYVAVGDPGVLCSFDTERLEPLEVVETEPGAHTTAWEPSTRSLFVFCPESCGAAVYREGG
jgi:DNA-binding beta-propeller fold protein YncE